MTLSDATTFQSELDYPLIQTTNQDRPWDVEDNPERRTNEENDKDLVCQEQTFERLLPVGVVHGVECRVYPTTSNFKSCHHARHMVVFAPDRADPRCESFFVTLALNIGKPLSTSNLVLRGGSSIEPYWKKNGKGQNRCKINGMLQVSLEYAYSCKISYLVGVWGWLLLLCKRPEVKQRGGH